MANLVEFFPKCDRTRKPNMTLKRTLKIWFKITDTKISRNRSEKFDIELGGFLVIKILSTIVIITRSSFGQYKIGTFHCRIIHLGKA